MVHLPEDPVKLYRPDLNLHCSETSTQLTEYHLEGRTVKTLTKGIGIVLIMELIFCGRVTSAQEAQFGGETTVNVIEVPVRVVDPTSGNPVMGLTARDFLIFENGKRQKITHFTEIARPAQLGGSADRTATAPATTESRLLEMVYFFDLYLMRKGPKEEALRAVRDRYEVEVPRGEEVSIVAYDGTLVSYVDRSDDRREILAALEELGGVRARGIEQELSFAEDLSGGEVTGTRDSAFYERRHRSQEYVVELERRVGRVGAAISATLARYARADARKVMVAFTPGQPRTRWSPSYSPVDIVNDVTSYPVKGLWQELSREASDLGFTLYAVDSSGWNADISSDIGSVSDRTGGITGGDSDLTDPSSSAGFAGPGNDANAIDPNAPPENIGPWMERVRKDLLISAAEDTGGNAYFSSANVAVETVTFAMEHYYSLAYVAKHSGDGDAYSIDVELPKHGKYRVHHRRAYIDRPASVRAAHRLRSAMLFGGDANPLGVRVNLGESENRIRLGAAGSKTVRLPIDIKIPIGRLEMVPQGDAYWGKVAVTVLAVDNSGNQSEPVGNEQEITVPADQIQQARAKGYYSYSLTVMIEGGKQRVFIGVEDLFSGRVSIMPQELTH
jgi:VWFA-related protein